MKQNIFTQSLRTMYTQQNLYNFKPKVHKIVTISNYNFGHNSTAEELRWRTM